MLPFSRRACQPFLMGKAPQRPALPRDTPKIRRANSEALLPRRGKQRRSRTLAAPLAPAGQGSVASLSIASLPQAGSVKQPRSPSYPIQPHDATRVAPSHVSCRTESKRRQKYRRRKPPASTAALSLKSAGEKQSGRRIASPLPATVWHVLHPRATFYISAAKSGPENPVFQPFLPENSLSKPLLAVYNGNKR